MANDISKINDTYAKGDEINTTIYDAYNNSCSYDTLKCKLYWDIYDSEGTIIEKNFIKNDTLALNYGFDKLTTNTGYYYHRTFWNIEKLFYLPTSPMANIQ